MSLGLDNPALLPFGVLVGLPVLLHLIARPRARLLDFPSLMLLERAHRRSVRLRRPRRWLLLVLRTLWTLLLVGVFLQPRWYAGGVTETVAAGRRVVLVVDATASLRAREGVQSRYTTAVNEAVAVLDALEARDRANVIRARAVPESFYTRPGVNRDFLIEQLRERPCSCEGGRLENAVRLAAEQLAAEDGAREIVVISDFQADDRGAPPLLEVPEGITLTTLPVADREVANQAVTHIGCLPGVPVSGQPFRISVEARNFGPHAVQRPLSLRVGGRVEQAILELPPRGSAVAEFEFKIEADTPQPLTASLEPDAFPTDDTRRLVLDFQPVLRAGVWGTDGTAAAWRRTLDALPGVAPVDLETPALLPSDLDLLLLGGWSGEGLPAVRDFVERGRPLFFKPKVISPELADWLELPEGTLSPSRMDPPIGLRIPDPWPDELELFRDGAYGSPARGLLYRHAVFPISGDRLAPVLALENGETVWGRVRAAPGVWYWNLSLDPEAGTLAAQAEWVPMFGEAVRHAFRPAETLTRPAGDRFPLPVRDAPVDSFLLSTEDGAAMQVVVADGVAAAAEPLPPGIYTWRNTADGPAVARRAINLPVSESDLRPTRPELKAPTGSAVLRHGEEWREVREGRPLWPWLLALAFAVALAEQIVTQREART